MLRSVFSTLDVTLLCNIVIELMLDPNYGGFTVSIKLVPFTQDHEFRSSAKHSHPHVSSVLG